MLTTIVLHDLFEQLGTPNAGRRLVEKARREAPVREVQSHRGNVITRYASQKMARAISAESRTCEFPAIVQYERDAKILEYYPQPVKLDLTFTDGGTKTPFRLQHTPDFLLITEDGIRLEEWREEERLVRLAAQAPGRYIRTEDGWRFPEMEEYLASLGIEYCLRSADEHPRQYIQNLTFLGDFLAPGCPPVEEKVLAAFKDLLEEQAVFPLAHLIERIAPRALERQDAFISEEGEQAPMGLLGATVDDLYKAIADGQLVVDLHNDDLGETDRVRVYRDEASLQFHRRILEATDQACTETRVASIEMGAKVTYEGQPYTIALVGETTAFLKGEQGTSEVELEILESLHSQGRLELRSTQPLGPTAAEALNTISPSALECALARRKWIDVAKVDPNAVPRSARTLRRYRKAMRDAGESLVDQHLALATNYDRCGYRERRLTQGVIDLIEKVAREQFNTPRNISKKAAYFYLLAECAKANLRPCSLKTFYKELENRKSVRARKGKRWAYQTDPIVWYLYLNEAIHGVRPFQYVHIDHTELDLLLCVPGRKGSLGKVWLTLAVDAESRAVLGFYLSFEAPSYRSCMMVLRDLVRRHGRMPEMLVLDNGKDFHSRALMRVCQLYGCSIRYRPAAQGRHGSVMERLFGTVNTQFIHLLEGNTQLMKHVRMTTKSVLPENFVAWTLPALHGAMDYFCNRIYGTEIHPAHGEVPLEHLERRLTETGERRNRLVRFDDTFRIETCPSPVEGDTRVVNSQLGVKINHFWYWSDAFRKIGMDGKQVEVRIDPWDVRVAYVLVGGQWHRCISKLMGLLRNLTVVELRYAYDEILKKYRTPKKELSPERVAEYLRVLDAKAFDPRLTAQQAEAKSIYEPLEMARATSEGKVARLHSNHEPVAPLGAPKVEALKPKSKVARVPKSDSGLVQATGPADLPTTKAPTHNASASQEQNDEFALF